MMAAQTQYDEYGNPIDDPIAQLQQRAQQSSNGYNGYDGSGINPDASKSTPTGPAYVPPQQSATTTWTRQNVRDTLARYGDASQENLLRAVQENPWLGTVVGGGKIRDSQQGGSGETWDVIGNLNDPTQTRHWQTLTGHTAAAKAAAAGKAGRAVPAGTPVVNAGSTTTSVSSRDNALRQQLIDQLLARSKQGLDVSRANNPAIRAASDAYAAQEERARRNYIADAAEDLGPLANIRGEERMAAERMGQRTGAYEADLVLREQTAIRQEIQDALDSLTGLISLDDELALRKELALMDDAINRLKLKEDSRQFNADLGYRRSALSEQGRQYDNTLGYNYDVFDWDRSALNPRNFPV